MNRTKIIRDTEYQIYKLSQALKVAMEALKYTQFNWVEKERKGNVAKRDVVKQALAAIENIFEQIRNEGLEPYPKKVCWPCANPVRKVKYAGGAMTVRRLVKCDVCGQETDVSTPGDYGWPDFPGFKKVKRPSVFD